TAEEIPAIRAAAKPLMAPELYVFGPRSLLRDLVPSAYNCPFGFLDSYQGAPRWRQPQQARCTDTSTRTLMSMTTLTRSLDSGASTCSPWTTRSSASNTP